MSAFVVLSILSVPSVNGVKSYLSGADVVNALGSLQIEVTTLRSGVAVGVTVALGVVAAVGFVVGLVAVQAHKNSRPESMIGNNFLVFI